MSFVRFVKLNVPAGNARPGPSIGQSLGPLGMLRAGDASLASRTFCFTSHSSHPIRDGESVVVFSACFFISLVDAAPPINKSNSFIVHTPFFLVFCHYLAI